MNQSLNIHDRAPRWVSLRYDWAGEILPEAALCSLSLNAEELLFKAIFPEGLVAKPGSEENKFEEGLWKYDVAEFFLAGAEKVSGQPQYLEVNLAPNGAWWASWFDEIRSPSKKRICLEVFEGGVCVNQEFNAIERSLRIPRSFLEPVLGLLEECRHNLTWVLGHPASRYLSLAKMPGEVPDFHQPNFFLPLS